MAGEKLRELSAGWMIWFKVTLVILPIFMTGIVAWATWVTKNQFADNAFRSLGPRYTFEQAAADSKKQDAENRAILLTVKGSISELELRIVELIGGMPTLKRLEDLERSVQAIRETQSRILAIMER